MYSGNRGVWPDTATLGLVKSPMDCRGYYFRGDYVDVKRGLCNKTEIRPNDLGPN